VSDIQTISTIAAEMSKTVAEACAAMTAAAEQFKAADTQPPPDVLESILARLEKLESAVEAIDMTVQKIDYDALSECINLSNLADEIDPALVAHWVDLEDVASNINPSDIAGRVELGGAFCQLIENKVRTMLREI
jgi:hypothetical protein